LSTLILGSDAEFESVRTLLDSSTYTEAEICRRFGIETLERFEEEIDRPQVMPAEDRTGLVVRLFIEGQYVELAKLAQCIDDDTVQAMANLGLIERDPGDSERVAATVALYPSAGVYVVSDRWNRPDRAPFNPGADVVYPAIVSSAQRFLNLMPRMSCARFLDLCSGTAVAGMSAADGFAEHAWAFDIAPRSTLFGEFNQRLNGIPNLTVATGDLYEPAGDRTFDRIVAHPPYVPVLRPKWIYHDGGEDGEQIVRRVIAGIPRYLEPGGLFYMLSMGSDRGGAPYEQRVREWLGEAQGEFDVAAFPVRVLDPEDFAVRAVIKSEKAAEDVRRFKQLFRSLDVCSMVYAVLLVQRRAEARRVFTIRRQLGTGSGQREILKSLEWETQMSMPGAVEQLMGARLRANPGAELRIVHRLVEGGWQPGEHVLLSSCPFSMEARTDAWVPYLLGIADGSRSLSEYMRELQQAEAIGPDAPPDEFARAVAVLVSGGFLSLEGQPS
jgi:methylase of polypeptide subunit release factors